MNSGQRYGILFCVILFAYGVDRLSKQWALSLQEPIFLLPGILEIQFIGNTHIFFYWDVPPAMLFLCIGVALFFLCGMLLKATQAKKFWEVAALLGIFSGAVSNLWDRIAYGYVIDFIRVPFWSVFNVADISIVGGVIAFSLLLWKADRKSTV